MRLSREARILLAVVAVAAAAWVWINFSNQAGPSVADTTPSGALLAEPNTLQAETPSASASVAVSAEPSDGPEPLGTTGDEPAVESEVTPEGEPEVEPEPLPAIAGRDVEVIDLPFLITSPPPPDAPDDLAAAAELELSRPTSEVRVTVNPFSPILLAPPPAEASAPAQASAANAAASLAATGAITEVAIPGAPTGSSPGAITEVLIPGAPANSQAGISPGTITAVPIPGAPSAENSAPPGTITTVPIPGAPNAENSAPPGTISAVAVPGAPQSTSTSANPSIGTVAVPGAPASNAPSAITEVTIPDVPVPGAPANSQAGISPGTITAVPIPGAPSAENSAPPGTISAVAVPGAPVTEGSSPDVEAVAVPGAPAQADTTQANATTSTSTGTSTGTSTSTPASAPTPEVNVPIDPLASNLPRTLPSGTLASTPEILRPSRNPALPGPNLAQVAALQLPGSSEAPALPLQDAPLPESLVVVEGEAAPLRPATPAQNASRPMTAGATPLSRYLRDHNYRFTGVVVGPVGVGVFRVGNLPTPVVVPLGQTLPETDIVLTSLQGKQAELTHGNDTQVLVLDLR